MMGTPSGVQVNWHWDAFGIMIGKFGDAGAIWFVTLGFVTIEFWPKQKDTK